MSAAPAAATDAVAPKAGGKRKLIILVAAVLLLVLAGGGGALYYLKAKAAAEEVVDEDAAYAEDDGDAPAEPAPRKKRKKARAEAAAPVFVPLDPFVVNLADHDTDRYAQIGVTLQVDDAKVGDDIAAYMPAVRNNILLLLSRKTAQDLAGAEGKQTLAEEVRREAVRAMGIEVEVPQGRKLRYDPSEDWPIAAVQFSSFIIQ